MPTECRHGLDEGLCDVCFPKSPVVTSAPARGAKRVATSASVKSSRPTTPAPNLLDQRVFHVTHVRNLELIAGAAGLVAGEEPEVDLSSPLARELRSTAEVSSGSPVSSHVPWYLSAEASVWDELRRGAADARWSASARAVASADLVVLVSTVRTLGDVVVADGDAAGTYTRVAAETDQTGRMLARLYGTDQAKDAEVLVKGSVPFDAVQLIGVANDPARDRVRSILDAAGVRTKVVVYPPWFSADT